MPKRDDKMPPQTAGAAFIRILIDAAIREALDRNAREGPPPAQVKEPPLGVPGS